MSVCYGNVRTSHEGRELPFWSVIKTPKHEIDLIKDLQILVRRFDSGSRLQIYLSEFCDSQSIASGATGSCASCNDSTRHNENSQVQA
jgi:hypothetical protein